MESVETLNKRNKFETNEARDSLLVIQLSQSFYLCSLMVKTWKNGLHWTPEKGVYIRRNR